MNHTGDMASNSRSATAFLLLRVAIGLSACWNAWPHLHGFGLHGVNTHTGLTLLVWLLQFVGGGMMVIGLLMPWSCIPLLIMAMAPLRWPPNLALLAPLLALAASMVGGPGRWAANKG